MRNGCGWWERNLCLAFLALKVRYWFFSPFLIFLNFWRIFLDLSLSGIKHVGFFLVLSYRLWLLAGRFRELKGVVHLFLDFSFWDWYLSFQFQLCSCEFQILLFWDCYSRKPDYLYAVLEIGPFVPAIWLSVFSVRCFFLFVVILHFFSIGFHWPYVFIRDSH